MGLLDKIKDLFMEEETEEEELELEEDLIAEIVVKCDETEPLLMSVLAKGFDLKCHVRGRELQQEEQRCRLLS